MEHGPGVVHEIPHPPQLTVVMTEVQLVAPPLLSGQHTSPEEHGRSTPFIPAGVGVHVPGAAAVLHDSHVPEQAVLQQTRSAQKLLVHSPLPAHTTPFAFVGLQTPERASQN
jgi:hypothetical protein